MDNVLLAFMLTLLAGLSTGIGSALAFFSKRTNKTLLSLSMGFSAGVMIYVSFVEILRSSPRPARCSLRSTASRAGRGSPR
jgi:ZIP family zinc transporter